MKKYLLLLLLFYCTAAFANTNRDVFAKYFNNYFVDTCSLSGDGIQETLDAVSSNIHSIELSPLYFQRVQMRFSYHKNVVLHQGDSAKKLGEVISTIHEPITFWLDGHYSMEDTAKGQTMTPLLAELEHIKQHPIKTHTILIDDMRQVGTDSFDNITLEQIVAKLKEINPNYSITYERGFVKDDVLVAHIDCSHPPLLSVPEEKKPQLIDFARNEFSQFGEDGIIEKIFEVIGTRSKICIEFGASDGFSLSNTANLWSKDLSWKAILIEIDPKRTQELIHKTAPYNCIPLCKKVGFCKDDSLEFILSEHQIPEEVALLSIDIDGNDIYVLQSLEKLRSRVLICEHNPTFPASLDIVGKADSATGCSIGALKRVAESKGYSLVAVTATNSIFVTNEELEKFAHFETAFEKLVKNQERFLRYVVTDYSGKYQLVASDDYVNAYGLASPMNEKLNGKYTELELPKR